MDQSDIASIVIGHAAFQAVQAADWRHVSVPKGDGMIRIEVDAEGVKTLGDLGVQIIGEFGDGNCVYLHPNMQRINLQVALYRRHRNTLVLGENTRLRGRLDMPSDENVFVAESAFADVGVSAMFRYHRGGLILGKGGSAPVTNYWIEGPGCSIIVGDDFLFSWGIWLRTADSHGLVDLGSHSIINRPKSIVLERHVWLGQDVIVMPGNRIAEGAVIGARSIVTKNVPRCCVAVGSPARVVRRDASWTRSANPDAAAIDALVEQMGGVAAVP